MNAVLDHFREQARFSEEYGSPFMARLIEHMLDDLEAGGPVADLVGAWSGNPRGDQVAVRLAGALHAAVLTGRDARLSAEYPAQRPVWEMQRVWPLARELLSREREWVADFIRSAPQTNEVRRSIALVTGFLTLAREHADLDTLEIGASAGLNLYWDRYRYTTPSWSWGPSNETSDVVIDTEWQGPGPPLSAAPRVHARAACDLNPLDISDPLQRLRLRSYIWADQHERLARFDAAAEVAVQHGVHVERADAARWLVERLRARAPDRLTVVYHSVFLQYPPREVREKIREAIHDAGEQARPSAPLAWLRLEPEAILGGPRESTRFLLDVITWPGAERRVLAITDGHLRAVCTDPHELDAALGGAIR
jgi:hypothetical protein